MWHYQHVWSGKSHWRFSFLRGFDSFGIRSSVRYGAHLGLWEDNVISRVCVCLVTGAWGDGPHVTTIHDAIDLSSHMSHGDPRLNPLPYPHMGLPDPASSLSPPITLVGLQLTGLLVYITCRDLTIMFWFSGWLVDITEDYAASFIVVGCGQLVAAIILFMIPLLTRIRSIV